MRKKPFIKVLFLSVMMLSALQMKAEAEDWIDNMFSVRGGTATSDMGNFIYGGPTISYSAPVENLRPFNITPPRLHVGNCGSDIFFGAFSMLDPEHYVAMAQGVIAAAPGYAFDLGLQALCTTCYQVKTGIEHIVQKLNGINLNSCQTMQWLGGKVLPESLTRKGQAGLLDGMADIIDSGLDWVSSRIDDAIKKVGGKDGSDERSASVLPEIAHYLFGFCLDRSCGNSGDLYIFNDQVFSDLKVCEPSFTAPRCSTNFNGNVPSYVSEMFSNVQDYITFVEYFVGKMSIHYDMQDSGNCTASTVTTCFTDWISGHSTCGGCKGTKVLSYNTGSNFNVALPETLPSDDSKLKSGFEINGTTFSLDKLIHSPDPKLGQITINICINGVNEFRPCTSGNVTGQIQSQLKTLLESSRFEKIASSASGKADGSASPGLIQLSGYWAVAKRLKSKYGPLTVGRYMNELSRAAAVIYVGTNLAAMTTYTRKIMQDLRSRFASADPQSMQEICAGYPSLIQDIETGIQNLNALEKHIYGQMSADAKAALNALKEALERNTGMMNLESSERDKGRKNKK